MNINYLKRCLDTPEEEFLAFVRETYPHAELLDADGRILIFVDNGSHILGVCHLDATMPPGHYAEGQVFGRPGRAIFSPTVDDRCGAYALLYTLPERGITVDLLFTVGEEDGLSTSAWFNPPKQYNWMFQFDRTGMDNVCYQYQNKDWLEVLEPAFGVTYLGLMSDIGFLEHLGCQGVNLGTGYYNYTTWGAYFIVEHLEEMINRFASFFEANKDNAYRHHPATLILSPEERMVVANLGLRYSHKRRRAGEYVHTKTKEFVGRLNQVRFDLWEIAHPEEAAKLREKQLKKMQKTAAN